MATNPMSFDAHHELCNKSLHGAGAPKYLNEWQDWTDSELPMTDQLMLLSECWVKLKRSHDDVDLASGFQ